MWGRRWLRKSTKDRFDWNIEKEQRERHNKEQEQWDQHVLVPEFRRNFTLHVSLKEVYLLHSLRVELFNGRLSFQAKRRALFGCYNAITFVWRLKMSCVRLSYHSPETHEPQIPKTSNRETPFEKVKEVVSRKCLMESIQRNTQTIFLRIILPITNY